MLGDWWTLLVVREAFFGTLRFADFEAVLGISKNVLAKRLRHLVRRGVLERVDAGEHGVRYEYALTPMGKDLATVMTSLRQWAIPRLRISGEDGRPLLARDLELRPGPGASKQTLARFRARRS